MEAKYFKVVRVSAVHADELDNVVNKFLLDNPDMDIIDIKPIDSHSVLILHKVNA